MGEYAVRKSDKTHIKIGTCEAMYYLRWDDIDKVFASYDLRQPGLWFRLPFPDEDEVLPGEYDNYNRGYRLLPYKNDDDIKTEFRVDDADEHPGSFQLTHPSGLLVGVKCYHGIRLPEGSSDIRLHWNGRDPYPWELCMVKNHEDQGLLPLVQCRHCGKTFRTNWEKILPHVSDKTLHDRLKQYAAFGA